MRAQKRLFPGGGRLYRFNNKYYKDLLAGKMEINPDDPGGMAYAQRNNGRLGAADVLGNVDENMQWVKIGSMANHGWDASVLNILAADILGIKYMRKPKGPNRQEQERKRRGKTGGKQRF